ncbi:MAG: LPS export ABC transporter ATP-binding protein [Spirochaetaceae bacterium]|nr:LPS export ABC transporter ATP-binding protein [Spirochaetaceae bacterium]
MKKSIKSETRLGVEGLRKVYRKKIAVVDVSFSMERGEIVGLLGPNGAGKTTVFYLIVGFIKPTSGSVYLGSQNISDYPMYKRARLGISYLPQETSIFRKLSVEVNIKAILEIRKDIGAEEKEEVLESLINELGISAIRKQKAFTLSGGERRRTEIARALAIKPSYLLLDEPFAGIDPIAVYEIKQIVKNLAAKGIGILITDHNVRDTLEITDRAYIISLGEILTSGSREEILANEQARHIYLGRNFSM